MRQLFAVEVRSNLDSDDWRFFTGPWVDEDAVHFLTYWNGQLGWNKYRMVVV